MYKTIKAFIKRAYNWFIFPNNKYYTVSFIPRWFIFMILLIVLSSPNIFAQQSWASISTINAPVPRRFSGYLAQQVAWTGTEMFVWGGFRNSNLKSGGLYNPLSDTWTLIDSTTAPSARTLHSVIWTGSKIIVWGGYSSGSSDENTGGIYNPVTNTWTATSTVNAPSGREGFTSIWTGSKMIVWGGVSGSYVRTGGIYDPETNSWDSISVINAPVARGGHVAVWTGTKMFVWGGIGPGYLNSGGLYDPETRTWTATSTGTGVPAGRQNHTAVWTGYKVIIWGGNTGSNLNSGGAYDPETNSWIATSTTNAPLARSYHTSVWTGNRMIVWGGNNGLNTGAVYNLDSNKWTAISTTGAPAGRSNHAAVWTGEKFIVWGGNNGSSLPINTGGYYTNAVLPVRLLFFNCQSEERDVKLSWATSWEINNKRFEIERSGGNEEWDNIGFIEGSGTTNEPRYYTYSDAGLSSGKYQYRLNQIDYNGNNEYHYLANEVIIGKPNKFFLSQNFPNPFNPATEIHYNLPDASYIIIKVYDISGKEIAVLVNEFKAAGYYSVKFNAENIANGVYFYRINAGSSFEIKKMIIIK